MKSAEPNVKKSIRNILIYAKVARAQILAMPALLCVCVYLYSKHHYEVVGIKSFVFVCISILLFNLSVNTISEYRDCQNGLDDTHSPGTKYRLISGIVPRKNVLYIGITTFILAIISGIFALYFKPYSLIIPGFLGAFVAFSYSEKPLRLKYRAYGEACVFFVYGALTFVSCILALTHRLSIQDVLFSIPFGIFTTSVVLANNIRDYEFEKHKTLTLPIKFGLKLAYTLLFFITHLAFLFVPFFIHYNIIPKTGIIAFFAYPLIFLAANQINSPKFINVFGIIQVSFSILMIAAFLISATPPSCPQ